MVKVISDWLVEPEFQENDNLKSKWVINSNNHWLFSCGAALIFFILVSAAFTWPLAINLENTLPDWGDGADAAWRIGSIAHQLRVDPLHLYNTSAFYPMANGLALDELLTGQGLLAAPIIWLTANPPLAFNLLVFLSFTLSGLGMWLLVRHLTRNSGAGLVAGLIFAFSPWHYGQYGHLGLGAQHWMIFALFFLIRFLEKTDGGSEEAGDRAARDLFSTLKNLWQLGLFILFFVLQAITAGYYAYFETILIGFYLAYYFIIECRILPWLLAKARRNQPLNPPDWRKVFRQIVLLAVAAIVALLLILPFIIPFVEAQTQHTFKRGLTEASYWSAAPNSLLRTVDHSWLYKPVQRGLFNLRTSPERMLYPGLVAVLLAAAGVYATLFKSGFVNKPASKRALPWLFGLLSLSGLVLSFGPNLNLEAYGLKSTGISLPYKWFYENIPGFNALRVPQRFGQLFMLGLAVCAGYGTSHLIRKLAGAKSKNQVANVKQEKSSFAAMDNVRKAILLPLLLILVGADYFAPGLPAQAAGTGNNAPPLYRWLASREAAAEIPARALLLELPIGAGNTPVNTNPLYLLYGLSHQRPMLNGSANIIPAGYDRLFNEMQSFPGPRSLDIAEGLGVEYLLVHTRNLNEQANRNELEKQLAPGGRLKTIRSFEDGPENNKNKQVVYQLIKSPERFEKLRSIIPEGAEVFLGDHSSRRKLYTTALPRLIGKNRRYFSSYNTIYNGEAGIEKAAAGRVYDYSVFYREANVLPAIYGYNSSNLVYTDPENIFEVYYKPSH